MPTAGFAMRRIACLALVCLAAAGPANVQAAARAVVQSYDASFFAPFTPQTALDMVNRLPGFVLDSGTELRGFANAAGNVLLDGEPPSSKSGGVLEALARVPAAQVVRIELVQGGDGGQGAGATALANVVRREVSLSGRWELVAVQMGRRPEQQLELSLTAPVQGWQAALGVSGYASRQQIGGTRTRRAADDSLLLFEQQDINSTYRGLTLSSEASRAWRDGQLTLSARADVATEDTTTRRDGFGAIAPPGALLQVQRFGLDSRTATSELGARWNGPLNPSWQLNLLTLGKGRRVENRSAGLRSAADGQPLFVNSSMQTDDALELIGRASLRRGGDATLRPEWGVELVFNRLDSTLEGAQTTPPAVPQPVPAQAVRVEEGRGEVFGRLAWTVSPQFSAEAGLALEVSRIRVSGGAQRERDLRYAKPSLSATWRPAEGLELRGSVRRSVGQLDFNDFAASAELASDRTRSGNPELVPDRRTRATLALDLRGQEGAALNLQVFAEQRQNVVDAVILSPGQGGTGNAGSARVWGLSASGALPLEGLAAGLRLSANGLWQDARFTDPATAQRRLLNDFEPQRYKVELRQDLLAQKRAWGLTLDGSLQLSSYFSNQSSRRDIESRWGVFLETSEFTGLKARLAVLNIGGYDEVRDNRFFTPDRTGAPAGRQALVFPYGQTVQFSVAGTF
jgi:hypothetical protein